MSHTSFETFQELATRGTFVPVCKEIRADLLTPLSAFLKVAGTRRPRVPLRERGGRGTGGALLLPGQGFVPCAAGQGRGDTGRAGRGSPPPRTCRFLDRLRGVMSDYRAPVVPGLPRFTGGAVGFLGYDRRELVRAVAGRGLVEAECAIVRRRRRRVHVVRHDPRVRPCEAPDLDHRQRACGSRGGSRDRILFRLREGPFSRAGAGTQPVRSRPSRRRPHLRCVRTRARGAFEQAVLAAKDHITAGDVYQVVLSQRFETSVTADPFAVYRGGCGM